MKIGGIDTDREVPLIAEIGNNHNGDFDRGDTTIRENVTLVHNRHELRFGGELVRLQNHLRNEYLQNA